MSDELAKLLAQYEQPLHDFPFAFIHRRPNDSKAGIDMAIFCFWAYQRKLLSEIFFSRSTGMSDALMPLSFSKLIAEIVNLVGYSITPSTFNERGCKFALKYLRPGWTYRYQEDLDVLFPEAETYSAIPENQSTLDAVFSLLDERLRNYENQ
jgi:hypothetical protein